ncbi:MAG: hypothetical protein CVU55_10135 [Deltaproteobacteria bacterium HGW-Deltaproteobacteria-13]|jgi:hypothetical protein|nr:MAG: hypothetical protein CVU55_10135 [Deltaproteobacteria bacterium HGW-Deltaproteobacteria-13]
MSYASASDFPAIHGPVKDMLKRYGLFSRLGVENFFPTIEQAVERYLAVYKIDGPDSGNVKKPL